VVGLLLMLCAGLWLGGHPAHLPPFLRGALVGGNAGLNVEATEAIEENYFREVSPDELTNSSLQGMVRGLRKRYEDVEGFSLDSDAAKPLLSRYPGGESQRRYYQDAAIRAVLRWAGGTGGPPSFVAPVGDCGVPVGGTFMVPGRGVSSIVCCAAQA